MKHEWIVDVEASFARCLVNEHFLDRFYEIFIKSHPAIKPMFANTDFTQQKELLRHGLMSVMMFAENDPMAKACLDRIRESHNRKHLAIDPGLYKHWVESLIKTVSEIDPDYSPTLETSWMEVIKPGVAHIAGGY